RLRPPFGHRRFASDDPPVRAGIAGSGADLLLLVWSATDLAREIEAGGGGARRAGGGAGGPGGATPPPRPPAPRGRPAGGAGDALGALEVPVGTVGTGAAARGAWELVDRVQCEVLVLEPATAATLFAAAPVAPRPWLRGIVWLVRGDGAAPPPVSGFRGWQ